MRGQVLEIATQVESLLGKLGASGRGIHERLTSVESKISSPMVKKIRWIASVRNKAAHETEFHVDQADFLRAGNEVIQYLKGLVAKAAAAQQRQEDRSQSEPVPKKPWSEMTGWERAATVGAYAAAGAVTLGVLFMSSK